MPEGPVESMNEPQLEIDDDLGLPESTVWMIFSRSWDGEHVHFAWTSITSKNLRTELHGELDGGHPLSLRSH